MRRLYQVLRDNTFRTIFWLVVLLTLSVVEGEKISKDFWNTYFFIIAQLPLYFLVLFGSHAMISIGWHLMVLEDCNVAHDELQVEIKIARADLIKKGVKL